MTLCGIASVYSQSIVKADGNEGELNSAELDGLNNQLMDTNAKMRVVARLGDGETANSLNQIRLQAARKYLVELRGADKKKVVFTEGKSVKGEGRLEFYMDGNLMLISLAKPGKNIRIGCCGEEEDAPPPKEEKKTDKPMEAKALAALIVELKGVVAGITPDKNEAKIVGERWDKRKDLNGKTKSEVIELLYDDVKAVIKDSGTQYQIYSIFSFQKQIPSATAQDKTDKPTDKPMEAKALAALIKELKGVVTRITPDKNEAKLVGERWDKRKDLNGKAKSEVIELLYADVKSVIKDSGTQYQIYSIFSFQKQIPDELPSVETKETGVVVKKSPVKLRLNNEDHGTTANTSVLARRLERIFKDRENNGVFRGESNEIETTVYLEGDRSVPAEEIAKLFGAVEDSGASPILVPVLITGSVQKEEQIDMPNPLKLLVYAGSGKSSSGPRAITEPDDILSEPKNPPVAGEIEIGFTGELFQSDDSFPGDKDAITVVAGKDGTFTMDGKQISASDLKKEIESRLKAKEKDKKIIFVQADNYGNIEDAAGIAASAGAGKVFVITKDIENKENGTP
jgi:biopolymer transport protein ExbD